MHEIPIIDGHNDTLLQLQLPKPGQDRSFFSASEQGHLDLPRAQQGGLGGGFFAIFTPSNIGALDPESGTDGMDQAATLQFTVAVAARLFRLEREAAGEVKIVRTVAELTKCLELGIFAIIFHIEGAEAIDTDLDALYVLHQAGLRSLGLTWSRPNAFGHGVPFQFPHSPDTGPGLTVAGRNLVRVCNKLGILVDLSHLNEKGFWDVAGISDAPLVATHSGAHELCAATRNLTDRQLDAVAESGGIVGVNFHVAFLREDGAANADTPLSDIARHVDYMVERMGIDHVALGSDFDGATMPRPLDDVAGLPKLMATLREHGYDDAELRKIAYENWLRVLDSTWK